MQVAMLNSVKTITKTEASNAARDYVKATLGNSFDVARPQFFEEDHSWSFFIEQRFSDLDTPVTTGRIWIDAEMGKVTPLTDDAIWDVQQCALVRAEHKRGNRIARGADGLVLPYQAKIKVNAYMSNVVNFFFEAKGQPSLIQGRPPFWRVTTALRLPDDGKIADFGTVDVNAISGSVVALTEEEIKARQEKSKHAAQCAKCATTSAG
ncbi:MAG: hypothetical protein AAF702_00610 [Chloroflexota bacterium]